MNVMMAGSRNAPLANCWVRKAVSRENQTTEEKAAPECTPPYSYTLARMRRRRRGAESGTSQVILKQAFTM